MPYVWIVELSFLRADIVEGNFKVPIDDHLWTGLNGPVRIIDKLGRVGLQVTNPVRLLSLRPQRR